MPAFLKILDYSISLILTSIFCSSLFKIHLFTLTTTVFKKIFQFCKFFFKSSNHVGMSCSRTSNGCEGFRCSIFSWRLWVFCMLCTCVAAVCSPGHRLVPPVGKAAVHHLLWYDVVTDGLFPLRPSTAPSGHEAVFCVEILSKVPLH